MTDQQQHHPISPPRELVLQWTGESLATQNLCNRSSQWGYDQRGDVNEAKLRKARDEELEACCEWLREAKNHGFGYEYGAELARRLRAARRPKPPSLKERLSKAIVEGDERQALKLLEELDDSLEHSQHHPPRTGGTSR